MSAFNTPSVSICYNGDFYFIAPICGAITIFKWDGLKQLFNPDISNRELGRAVLESLNVSIRENKKRTDIKNEYDVWIKMLLSNFNYKTSRYIFRKMKKASMIRENTLTTFGFEPLHKKRADYYYSIKGERISIPITDNQERIGQIVMETLGKSTY